MRPQDIVIIFKLISKRYLSDDGPDVDRSTFFTAKSISDELKISQAEVGHSMRRSQFAGLISSDKHTVAVRALYEFLVFGIKYVFPVKPGHLTKGIPTAHSALPLRATIQAIEQYVWPHEAGEVRGQAIEPLFHTVPDVAPSDERFYQLLALTDALRVGRSREILLAREALKKLLFIEN
ncbi:hypothetical protein [Hymenobacter citatus]|nr:hypothetical protein [Hymenobacter citatus]